VVSILRDTALSGIENGAGSVARIPTTTKDVQAVLAANRDAILLLLLKR
jgi:hypothetical protein